MKPIAQILFLVLACVVGSQIQVSNAQFTATIRIQSCRDNSFLQVPQLGGPPTTTTTTTTPASTTTADPPAGNDTATTPVTEPVTTPAPVSSGGGSGGTMIIRWQVNWTTVFQNGTGSVMGALDSTTRLVRCFARGASNAIGVENQQSIPTAARFMWTFTSIFDSVSWTYRYQIKNKANDRCLKSQNGVMSLVVCRDNDLTMLYNLLQN